MKKKNRKKSAAISKNQSHRLAWNKSPTFIARDRIIGRITLVNGDPIEIRLVKGKRVFRRTKNDGDLTQSQYQDIQNRKTKEINDESKRKANSLNPPPILQGGSTGLKK